MKVAKLRVCASCEWIFYIQENDKGCTECGFGHYSAHYVYGKKAYEYAKTQKPWYDKKLADYSFLLNQKIKHNK